MKGLEWYRFGGSSSVLHRPPVQKVAVNEWVGGMLGKSNTDGLAYHGNIVLPPPIHAQLQSTPE
jgi:hypothetical protein